MSAKILVTGLPNAGKTTLLKTLQDVLVFAYDGKVYPFPQPHVNLKDFDSVDELLSEMDEKITAYEQKFNQLPEIIAIDSVSRIFTRIVDNSNKKFTGFNVWTEVNKEIKKFVDFINDIVANNINIVIVAHAIKDENTGKYSEVAQGNFAKMGAFLSTVDYAVFVEIKGSKRVVRHRNIDLARTLLADIPDSEDATSFSLLDYINKINNNSLSISEWSM